MIRRLTLGALALVVAAVAIVVAAGGEDHYSLRLDVANASGLKTGSPVVISGVKRGEVELHLGDDDRVQVEAKIDREAAPVGRDVKIALTASNFLGQKRLEIDKGDVADPAPDGYRVPVRQVTTPTDLDQVLSVLDADTRTRARILLNELGAAVLGRRADISRLIGEFPAGFRDLGAVVDQVRSDNHSLRDVVTRTDRFVAEATAKRADVVRAVRALGETSETVAAKREELKATLARAPRTLRTLQAFLADLERTAEPLEPAADAIAQAAGPLDATLAEVGGFTDAARPALDEARDVAPKLTRLAREATPVLRRAQPAVSQLSDLSADLVPVTDTLHKSSDNILAVLENWSRAIQFRDGLGHVFRGEASWSPELIESMISRLTRPVDRRRRSRARTAQPRREAAPQQRAPERTAKRLLPEVTDRLQQLPRELQQDVDRALQETTGQLKESIDGLLQGTGGRRDGSDGAHGVDGLLDFLLAP